MSEDKKEEKDEDPTSVSGAEAEAARAKAELEEAKEKAVEPTTDIKPETISDAINVSKEALTATEAIAVAEAAYTKSQSKLDEVRKASEAAWTAEYEKAKASVVKAEAGEIFTDKRKRERIFRREMGEPEFIHKQQSLAPSRPVLTQTEEQEISKRVLIPTDQTPKYEPENPLSPEYGGTSNYETGINNLVDEKRQKLERLRNDPNTLPDDITRTEQDLKYLDSLYDNFYHGMNVFRTAKGGRSKLRE
jgi:colicin import membrane protein|tara:strand:+ start:171 stop:914 length:744 start_codon:yes stop_codon:yes gene_type:complete